jgi:hypothetical protein
MTVPLPRVLRIRQRFEPTPRVDIAATLESEFRKLDGAIRPGAKIAVGVGSRGITHLTSLVRETLRQIQLRQASPFIVPAMGSHGGATPEGQIEVLASYGITSQTMGVPIQAAMETVEIGRTPDGIPVFCGADALAADGIVLVNRIKPHTDFFGSIGSGLLKMCVIGLGKRQGAEAMHLAATQWGYEHAIKSMARCLLGNSPVLGGVAVLENQYHDTAQIVVIPNDRIEPEEPGYLERARKWMPLLPFQEIDLLVLDRIGKNISGTGMDPNVINRSIHGYDSLPVRGDRPAPFIRRILVRDLTPETHGNAIGIGMADATTTRLTQAIDTRKTNINALTALTPQSAKIPVAFDSDREAIERMLISLPIADYRSARLVRAADTLSVAELFISETLWREVRDRPDLEVLDKARKLDFDSDGNLN